MIRSCFIMPAFLLALILPTPVNAAPIKARVKDSNMPLACIGLAAQEFGLPPRLLHALYLTERGRTGYAMRNPNGSLDHGAFQINSIWLKKLNAYGIDGSRLAWDPLVNARVGAWRLKSEIINAGGDVWRGVGNYRSRTPKYHNEQIARVAKHYRNIGEVSYRGIC